MRFRGRLKLVVETLHRTICYWMVSGGLHMVDGTQELSQLAKYSQFELATMIRSDG